MVLVQAKNAALKEAGAIVPDSFEALEGAVKQTYDKLVADGILVPQPDVPAPSVPLDLEAAKKAGKARAISSCSRHSISMSSLFWRLAGEAYCLSALAPNRSGKR